MGFKFAIILYALFSCFSLVWGENVRLTVDGSTAIANTDDNFVCATLDWWPENKCDYNQCPWGNAGILNLDLRNKILQNAIKAFSPLRIRVGGSLQDQVVYQVGRSIKKCPRFKKRASGLFGFSRGCLPMMRWDELNNLFRQTGAKVTFGLNALYGRIKTRNDTLWTGNWNSMNAHDLMKYTISKGYKIGSYEFGNELCGQGISARVEVMQYAKDTLALKALVKKLYPNPTTQPKVLGPSGFYDANWFKTYLQVTGPGVIDGLSHHIYNLGPGVDQTLIYKVQDPSFLSQVSETYKNMATSIQSFGSWSGAWVGEAGGAYNSGGKNVSNTFANGFWYLDQLGMTSSFNHKVFCRQTLIGGNYGLLNTANFNPNPDYYGALLWHRLMGPKVLRTTHGGSPYFRVYAHCSKAKPGISLLLINMSNSTSFEVSNLNNGNERQREEYHLTPKGGNIQSNVVLLNGNPLGLTSTMDIPPMNPKMVDASIPIQVAPDSFVFITLKGFNAPVCN